MSHSNLPPSPHNLPNNFRTMNPTPSSLPINIHGNSRQTRRKRQPPNNKERTPNPQRRNPIINIKRQSKRKSILDEIHRRKCFTSFISVRINDISHNTSGSELNTKVD